MSAASTAAVADEGFVFFLRFFFFFLEDVVSVDHAVDLAVSVGVSIGRLPVVVASGSGDC